MKITTLPTGFKPTPPFTRPAHIKADTHYVYTTQKYVAEIVYHSSMFYAPDFFTVSVKDMAGSDVWNGGKALFLDSLFKTDFISDEFDRMILTRVNSTESARHCQPIMVNLKTGKEEPLNEEGVCGIAGHFISFDAVYFDTGTGVKCIDYSHHAQFMLTEVLNTHFATIKAWGACPVEGCLLVITGEEENNVYLFNLYRQQVIDKATLAYKPADSFTVNIEHVKQRNSLILSLSYSDKQASGTLKYTGTDYFNLEF